jgi:protein-S-isoprenylcysteine O-methyltransferase Ste14
MAALRVEVGSPLQPTCAHAQRLHLFSLSTPEPFYIRCLEGRHFSVHPVRLSCRTEGNAQIYAAGREPAGERHHQCRFSVHPGGDVGNFLADQIEGIRRTKLYDLFAAAPLIAWLLFSAAQMVPSVAEQLALVKLFVQTDSSVLPVALVLSLIAKVCTLIFLAALVMMFAVRRVPQRHALGFYPRFAAVAGTVISIGIVWLPPRELSSSLYLVSLLLTIGGTAFAVCAVLVLARSISVMPEARRLITSGPYTLMRHPLYLGEMVATAGLALQYLMPWALLLLGLHCIFQFERMRNEERVLLLAFPHYRDYMAGTARLVPGVY